MTQQLGLKSGHIVRFVCLGIEDFKLKTELLQIRTDIWTAKYHESPSRSGLELDEYDACSEYVALVETKTNALVGGCRIVSADQSGSLPMSASTGVRGLSAIEISRFFILRVKDVTDQREMLQWFLQSLSRHLSDQGHVSAFATIRAHLYYNLVELDVPMKRIALNQMHANKRFIPVVLWPMDQCAVRKVA